MYIYYYISYASKENKTTSTIATQTDPTITSCCHTVTRQMSPSTSTVSMETETDMEFEHEEISKQNNFQTKASMNRDQSNTSIKPAANHTKHVVSKNAPPQPKTTGKYQQKSKLPSSKKVT